jgi:hypothetical protein
MPSVCLPFSVIRCNDKTLRYNGYVEEVRLRQKKRRGIISCIYLVKGEISEFLYLFNRRRCVYFVNCLFGSVLFLALNNRPSRKFNVSVLVS